MARIVERAVQIAFWTVIGVLIATGVALIYPKHLQYLGLERKRSQIEKRIAETRNEIAALKEKQKRFATDREFVEELARESRRVYPGEVVFIFKE